MELTCFSTALREIQRTAAMAELVLPGRHGGQYFGLAAGSVARLQFESGPGDWPRAGLGWPLVAILLEWSACTHRSPLIRCAGSPHVTEITVGPRQPQMPGTRPSFPPHFLTRSRAGETSGYHRRGARYSRSRGWLSGRVVRQHASSAPARQRADPGGPGRTGPAQHNRRSPPWSGAETGRPGCRLFVSWLGPSI